MSKHLIELVNVSKDYDGDAAIKIVDLYMLFGFFMCMV